MKVKVNELIFGVDGFTVIPNSDTGESLTLRNVCINSILAPLEGDDEKKRFEKYEIFKKLRDCKDEDGIVELTAEQISTLKKSIGKLQPPLILGQCFELLEQNIDHHIGSSNKKK
jgi:hypothetical protein